MSSESPDDTGNESQTGPIRGSTRVSQRQPQSCTECTRRKTKCDKVVPCINCKKRGLPERCHIEQVIQSKTLSQGSRIQALRHQMSSENARLNARVAQLESLVHSRLGSASDELDQSDLTSISEVENVRGNGLRTIYESVPSSGSIEGKSRIGSSAGIDGPMDGDDDKDDEAEAAATLEFLAMGRIRAKSPGGLDEGDLPKQTEWYSGLKNNTIDPRLRALSLSSSASASAPPRLPYRPEAGLSVHRLALQKDILARLPPIEVGRILVRYDIEQVAWMHCCYDGQTLQTECDIFWSELGSPDVDINWSFLALLFGVLMSAVYHLPAATAAALFPGQLPRRLLEVWFEACTMCLHEANWMSSHSLYAVQCIAIIISPANHLDKADLYFTLLGAAIRIAQALNLHRIGPDPTSHGTAFVAREVRKRTWAQLLIQDWFHVAFNGTCSIHRSQFNTPPPLHCGEHVLADNKIPIIATEVPAIDSHTCELLKLAVQINRAYTSVSQLGPIPYETLLDLDREMQAVLAQAPWWMRDEMAPIDPSAPAWFEWQTRTYMVSAAHKVIVLHRPYLGRSFRGDGRYAHSHDMCLIHAHKILRIFKACSLETFRKTWTVLAHVIAACLVLVLDASQHKAANSPIGVSVDTKILPVQETINILRGLTATSSIAERGVFVLSPLMDGLAWSTGAGLGQGKISSKNRPAFGGRAERELDRAVGVFRRGQRMAISSASSSTVTTLPLETPPLDKVDYTADLGLLSPTASGVVWKGDEDIGLPVDSVSSFSLWGFPLEEWEGMDWLNQG